MEIRTSFVDFQGKALLTSPQFNKGTAFTHDERRQFKLQGLLPQRINSLEQQTQRSITLKKSMLITGHIHNISPMTKISLKMPSFNPCTIRIRYPLHTPDLTVGPLLSPAERSFEGIPSSIQRD